MLSAEFSLMKKLWRYNKITLMSNFISLLNVVSNETEFTKQENLSKTNIISHILVIIYSN